MLRRPGRIPWSPYSFSGELPGRRACRSRLPAPHRNARSCHTGQALAIDEEARRCTDAVFLMGLSGAPRRSFRTALCRPGTCSKDFLGKTGLLGDKAQLLLAVLAGESPTSPGSRRDRRSWGRSGHCRRSGRPWMRRPPADRSETPGETKRALPVSMYFFLTSGKTVS